MSATRGQLPEILAVEDLAEAFRIQPSAARKRLAAGAFGPRVRIGRRWYVRRDSLLAHLAELEEAPPSTDSAGPDHDEGLDPPSPEYSEALRRAWP